MAKNKAGQQGSVKNAKTPELAKQVEAMAAYGITHGDIASCLGISEDSLQRHYRKELDQGSPKAIARVAERLYKKCLDGDTTSMIFWLKTRAKWRDSDNTPPPSQPLQPIEIIVKDARQNDSAT